MTRRSERHLSREAATGAAVRGGGERRREAAAGLAMKGGAKVELVTSPIGAFRIRRH